MRLIDIDAFDDFLASAEIEAINKQKYVLAGALNTIRGNLRNFPSAEPKKGKWILFDAPWYQCSECGAVRENKSFMENFCPNCGADMRGNT